MSNSSKESNYQRYVQMEWTRPDFYPLDQPVDATLYRPVATWIGRLLLYARAARDVEGGCGLEIHHADTAHAGWVGKQLRLRYANTPATQIRKQTLTRDVSFTADVQKLAAEGAITIDRVNGWPQVSPLESLAAGHPQDDIIVRLVEPVVIDESPSDGGAPILMIEQEPVQISGRFVGLVTFLAPANQQGDHWRVRHYNAATHAFDGAEEIVAVPAPAADDNNTLPSTSAEIDKSPLNPQGWYIYGAPGRDGLFVIQAWTPRALLRLEPQRVLTGAEATWRYIRHEVWSHPVVHKGRITSVLCDTSASGEATARASWKVGDQALLLYTYSGIGGKQREPSARYGLYFGHFAFGVASVIHEPLADEARFDITFYQVYTQNVDGMVAGVIDWSRFMGDRQFGWSGIRPSCNILIKFDEINDRDLNEVDLTDSGPASALDLIRGNLQQMVARYRIGDGRGATFVTAANNCAQDSCQAVYDALGEISTAVSGLIKPGDPAAKMAANPTQAARLQRIQTVAQELRVKVAGDPARREDWRYKIENLGISENPLRNALRGLESWRAIFPRKTSDTVAQTFLAQGATMWVLCTYQIGGANPNIEPIAPLTF